MRAAATDSFDRLALDAAEGRISRRSVLRMLLAGAAAGLVGGIGLGGIARAQDDACAEGERRVAIRDAAHLQQCKKKVKKQGYTASFNGCGAEGEGLGQDSHVPDGVPAVYDFFEPCKQHDICYGTCGSSQQQCDDDFYNRMVAHCAQRHAWWNPLGGDCRNAAWIYHAAVSSGGEDAYAAAQVKACDCCESQCVRCSCNQTIYTSSQQCLDECQVSLGCFTNICEPIECP